MVLLVFPHGDWYSDQVVETKLFVKIGSGHASCCTLTPPKIRKTRRWMSSEEQLKALQQQLEDSFDKLLRVETTLPTIYSLWLVESRSRNEVGFLCTYHSDQCIQIRSLNTESLWNVGGKKWFSLVYFYLALFKSARIFAINLSLSLTMLCWAYPWVFIPDPCYSLKLIEYIHF